MTALAEATGGIGFLTVATLLRDVVLRRATGQLTLRRSEAVRTAFFKNGSLIYATSNLDADRLGDILLARGMITREQYDEAASRVVATGRKQGTVLVQIGALSPKDLFRGLIAQVREIVLSLVAWDEGTWRFEEGLPPRDEIVSLRIAPQAIVFEGLGRVAGDPRFARHWDPGAFALTANPAPPLPVGELDCPAPARRILALIEHGRPWAEVPRLAGVEELPASALLYGLALFGAVEVRTRAAAPQPAAAEPAPAPAQTPAAGARESAAPAPDAESRRLREKIVHLAAKLPSLNLYQLLGLTPEAEQDAIKRAYIALAKEYHPDRFFRPGLEDIHDRVNAVFMRINEAYTTLHSPTSRGEYDRETLRIGQAPERPREPERDSRVAQEQFQKGIGLLNGGDVWSAIQSLRWAVNLSPQNPRYHTFLGVALTRTKKRLHEAEEHCKTAIALDYNNPQYYVHLGQVYRAGHLYDKAKRQYEQALKLDPKHAPALRELGELRTVAREKGVFDKIFGK